MLSFLFFLPSLKQTADGECDAQRVSGSLASDITTECIDCSHGHDGILLVSVLSLVFSPFVFLLL